MGDVLTIEEAVEQRKVLTAQGKTLVFSNGHFDLFHAGHLDYLEKARQLGDALFVGVNDDEATRRLKGPGRPLIPAVERARLLAALEIIDGAIVFPGDTAIDLIQKLAPDVYAKGGDYHHKVLPEREVVESLGGQVILIDFVPKHSTSDLLARIKALPEDA